VNTVFIVLTLFFSFSSSVTIAEQWRSLEIAPEKRCSPYNQFIRENDYKHLQSLEPKIVAEMGGWIYGPYTGRIFTDTGKTDIEHIIAISEAHDSGLCAADHHTRKQFANDMLNLTLAAPEVNRCNKTGKCDKDAAEWLPVRNQCWFANRIVEVRIKYGLTINKREVEVLDEILSGCNSVEMIFYREGGHR